MEEKSLNPGGARVPAIPLPLPPVPASQPCSSSNTNCSKENKTEKRLRFTVELNPGETTIVSWKRLVKDSGGIGGVQLKKDARADVAEGDCLPQPGQPGLVKQGENDPIDGAPQTNRFSSVIEKIERLYMGRNSSDEEEDRADAPDDDQYDTEDSFIDDTELDEYFQADNLVTKHTGYFVNKGKLEQIEASAPKEPTPKKRRRKDANTNTNTTRGYSEKDYKKTPQANRNTPPGNKAIKSRPNPSSYKRNIENIPSKDLPVLALESRVYNNQSRITAGEGYNSNNYLSIKDKGISGNTDVSRGKFANGENDAKLKKEKKGELVGPGTSASIYHPIQQMQTPTGVREESFVRPKISRLDRAIKDLEKIVSECRPQSTELHEADPANPTIKRRLPQDVKLKLAKVARLSAGQDKVSEEQLIDRLMGILGHLVQRKTLKRNIREMVELGLSAKQVRADRFQQIKKEINELIKSRISSLKSKVSEQQQLDGSADDFQEIGFNSGALKGKFTMDSALEDKICDLYDLYVEGMDEDKGPQSRKLYVELAELWPHGYMDNVGIKEAISRSKERKRALYARRKVLNEEKMTRKRLSSQQTNNNNSNSNNLNMQPKPVQMSTGTQAIVPYEKPVPNPNPNLPVRNPSSSSKTLVEPTALYPEYYQNQGSKKLKRKPDTNIVESHPNPNPNPIRVSKEKQLKPNNPSDKEEANLKINDSRANKGSTILSFSTNEAS